MTFHIPVKEGDSRVPMLLHHGEPRPKYLDLWATGQHFNMYAKHFVPLESDPAIFSSLMHRLGVKDQLEFVDVYSLDDDCLIDVPRPVFTVIVIFLDVDTTNYSITGFGDNHVIRKEKYEVV
ncbi:ubiquitinyl hydrolase 1 [Exophiala xenobiotica]|nr:ubiquitinyl hydrolase 1 [Exophiala xenobiotica]